MMISRSKHRSSVEVCSDCGASDPSWASINRGLLLCAECCSVHRSMGRHISHVKSLRQGSWPPSLLSMVQALTAQNVNSIWEYSLLDVTSHKHLRKKPQPKDPLHPIKSEFILAKHLRLTYVLRARRDEPASELGRQLHSAVRSFSLDTAMRLLAQGADPNYYNPEKGNTCLHVACRAGQPAQAELLVAWGADPTAKDSGGNTPADCARQGGHSELGDRMVELVYEATDRMIYFLSGEKPDHASGRHYIIPRVHDTHEMTDVAKAARGKLQLLPNHLFEELVMDIYDEVDRRETEAIWQTSASGLERCGVAFLPVNPALSAPRNQGRQKLARLLAPELAALVRDVLLDATRRQRLASLHPRGPMNPQLVGHSKHFSQMSDDEPLYDSVASDDDYASLAPVGLNQLQITSLDLNVTDTYPQQSLEHSNANVQSNLLSTQNVPEQKEEIETLKKELDTRNSTITELKNQLKSLQTIVEQLTKENSVLKTNSVDDDQSITSQNSINESNNTLDLSPQETARSLESEQLVLSAELDVRQSLKCAQRPVSMFETREGPKNNWQVTKHQLTTIPGLERSLTQSVLEGGGRMSEGVSGAAGDGEGAEVQRRAEDVTRCIQELWAAARTRRNRLPECATSIERTVAALLVLFPQLKCTRPLPPAANRKNAHWAVRLSHKPNETRWLSHFTLVSNERGTFPDALVSFGANQKTCSDSSLQQVLNDLRSASDAVVLACSTRAPLERVRASAYELAKAVKLLLTRYPPP